MENIKYFVKPSSKHIEIKKCLNTIHSTRAHLHDEMSFGIIEEGACDVSISNRVIHLSGRTALIIPAGAVHQCVPVDEKNWKFRMLYVDQAYFEKAVDNGFNLENFEYLYLSSEKYRDISVLFDRFEEAPDVSGESEFLTDMVSLLAGKKERFSFASSCTTQMSLIREYIYEHFMDDISLSDLEDIVPLSRYQIIRRFESAYGLPPHKYINALRINHSMKLLKKGRTMAAVALDSGFYDQSHFIKRFREHTGTTPLKYLGEKEN